MIKFKKVLDTFYQLTLSAPTVFFLIFEKTQANLLYWFATQHQVDTSRRQNFDLFYQKFSA